MGATAVPNDQSSGYITSSPKITGSFFAQPGSHCYIVFSVYLLWFSAMCTLVDTPSVSAAHSQYPPPPRPLPAPRVLFTAPKGAVIVLPCTAPPRSFDVRDTSALKGSILRSV